MTSIALALTALVIAISTAAIVWLKRHNYLDESEDDVEIG